MTLAQIIRQAMLMLGEDPEDISEYEELFRGYANTGYRIALEQYAKPRETRVLTADERGMIRLEGQGIRRIVSMQRPDGTSLRFRLMPEGSTVMTDARSSDVLAVCEVSVRDMEKATDEPRLPGNAQAALCDYICYRHLSSGNLAKQGRAKVYKANFYEEMGRIQPEGFGSVTRMKGLYDVT